MNLKVSTSTIVRTVILILALFNQIMSASGHAILPISDETAETAVTTIATIVVSIVTWWKNNSFTTPALIGDMAMKEAREHE